MAAQMTDTADMCALGASDRTDYGGRQPVTGRRMVNGSAKHSEKRPSST
jgi:hypothetical protein